MAQSITTLLAILATFVVNSLSNLFPPKGLNVGEIANTILSGVLITPANYAFAIWGVIYVGLIAYGVYQLRPQQRQDIHIRRVNLLLIAACCAQVIWIYLFTLRLFGISILAMLGILAPLVLAYRILYADQRVSRDRQWMARIPFSIYLAWIAVATVVNVASALYAGNWSGWGISPVVWTAVMIGVTGAIAAYVVWVQRDLAFLCVFLWAYGAIAQRQLSVPIIRGTAVGIILILILWFLWVTWFFAQRSKSVDSLP
jgi:hypothetical protein